MKLLSSLDEDDDGMLASGLEEVDWWLLILLNATQALAGEKTIALLEFLQENKNLKPRGGQGS
jgi:hypothetical protein